MQRFGLHTDEQVEAVKKVTAEIREKDLRTVRVVIVDQHGIPRAKFLSAEAAIAAMSSGSDFSGAIYSLDTANSVFPPAFAAGGGFGIEEFSGFPDVVIVPDPHTFRVLPWADRTGWVLCDVYFSNGRPVPLDGRAIMREQLRRLHEAGYGYTAGLEVEYYIVRLVNERIALDQTGAPPPPPVSTSSNRAISSSPRRGSTASRRRCARFATASTPSAFRRGRWRMSGGPVRWSSPWRRSMASRLRTR